MHKHHILPKYLGGADDSSNIETITIEEHAERHRFLFEKYGNLQDELAWKGLLKQIDKEEITKRLQKLPKSVDWKRKMSERMKGSNNPNYGKPGTMLGKKMSESAKAAISRYRKSTHK